VRQSRRAAIALAAALVAATAGVARAQGNSQSKGHKSAAPSESPLPAAAAAPITGASPIAWLDDATLLPTGSMALTISVMRWSGTDLSEVDAPVADVAVAVAPRVQFGLSVPRIVGSSDAGGPVGGVGTLYVTGKVALLKDPAVVKLAIAPMVRVLGPAAAAALLPGEGRTQFGLPVNAEVTQGPVRMYASAGFFTGSVWFFGAGAAAQPTPRVGISAAFTHSWASADADGLARDRLEVSGGISYLLGPQIGVYGSVGQTIGTAPENGAGTTISGGVTLLVDTRSSK
jgi:hypothetical protein